MRGSQQGVLRACVFAALVAGVVSLWPVDAQDGGAAAQGTAFKSSVDAIPMNVTVTDGSRRFLTDLDQQDFHIFEDGRPQQIRFFQKSGVPLALAILIDTSASMDPNLSLAQEAAVGFVRALDTTDVASVVEFNSRVQTRQEFTSDRKDLERAIRKTTAVGSTALYNAVYISLRDLNKTIKDETLSETHRRAIVILSDGEDTSSVMNFDEVLDLAARSDVAIYAIGLLERWLPGIKRPNDAQFVLKRFAEQTGGRVFFPTEAKELAGIYREIRTELSNQYFLAYESDNPKRDGGFRRINVRVERPGAVARARPGYYAPNK